MLEIQELIFLGDVISDKGTNPDPAKIQVIEHFPAPTNRQEVQRFLGKYVPDPSAKSDYL